MIIFIIINNYIFYIDLDNKYNHSKLRKKRKEKIRVLNKFKNNNLDIDYKELRFTVNKNPNKALSLLYSELNAYSYL